MSSFLSAHLKVLATFLIPFGGGIPSGALLAQSSGIHWAMTSFLYLVSDIILACIFDPIMWWIVRRVKRSPQGHPITTVFREALLRTIPKLGVSAGPLSLILIAFGVDPMTGRIATAMAGHGFITGWALSITGDMIFFGLILASTLFLNGILGNGDLTALLVLAGMFGIPALYRRLRTSWN